MRPDEAVRAEPANKKSAEQNPEIAYAHCTAESRERDCNGIRARSCWSHAVPFRRVVLLRCAIRKKADIPRPLMNQPRAERNQERYRAGNGPRCALPTVRL